MKGATPVGPSATTSSTASPSARPSAGAGQAASRRSSRPVQPGDVVEVEVEGLGKLTNTIVHGPTPIRDDCGAQPTESEEVISTAMGGDWEFRGLRAAGGQGAAFYESALETK